MTRLRTRTRGGFSTLEITCVLTVIALMLALGFALCRGMRAAARVSCAESRLRQISTGMELYFRRYNSYPPQGSDLVAELAPFVENPEVFANPMLEEAKPGATVSALYVPPTLGELDSPDHYITAMVNGNGKTVLILKTGHKVERRDDLRFIPSDLADSLAAILDPPNGLSGGEPIEEPSGTSLTGLINLNPRNNSDFEFEILTSAGTFTRDDLHASNGTIDYEGAAWWIRFYPKGNGNQNWLTWGGEPYPVRNGRLYTIAGPMTVHLYNERKGNGRAMGRWWIEISASHAVIWGGTSPVPSP